MPSASSSSVTIEYLDRDKVLEALRKATTRLVELRPEVRRVLLFGSLATGRHAPGSDADLLIVVSHSDRLPPFRAAPYLLLLSEQVPLDLDLLVWTEEEVRQARASRHPFLAEVETVGMTLL